MKSIISILLNGNIYFKTYICMKKPTYELHPIVLRNHHVVSIIWNAKFLQHLNVALYSLDKISTICVAPKLSSSCTCDITTSSLIFLISTSLCRCKVTTSKLLSDVISVRFGFDFFVCRPRILTGLRFNLAQIWESSKNPLFILTLLLVTKSFSSSMMPFVLLPDLFFLFWVTSFWQVIICDKIACYTVQNLFEVII